MVRKSILIVCLFILLFCARTYRSKVNKLQLFWKKKFVKEIFQKSQLIQPFVIRTIFEESREFELHRVDCTSQKKEKCSTN